MGDLRSHEASTGIPGEVSTGIQLRRDGAGVTVLVDGQPQSYVDLADPRLLAFEYIAIFAACLAVLPTGPVRVTHIGGAGLTLARYVAVERPGSPQLVLEPDEALTTLVRRELPLPRGHRIRVRAVSGQDGIDALATGSADAIVIDAYAGGRMPGVLCSTGFLGSCVRVLGVGGMLLVNAADEPGLRHALRTLATIRAAGLDLVGLAGTAEVVKGRRFGNAVLVAGRGRGAAWDLHWIARSLAGASVPARLRHGPELDALLAGARPWEPTGIPPDSPTPPELGRWRIR